MRKKWRNIIFGMVMTAMCCVTMVQSALAAEKPEATIPVEISLSGTLPETPEDFTVQLKADDAGSPMPEGAENGIFTMTVTGAAVKNIPAITYDRVGIYTYTIAQIEGTNEKCTYDKTVYTLYVAITNAEDGSGLELTANLYPNGDGAKTDSAKFENAYEVVPTATPTVTVKPTEKPEATVTIEPTKKADNTTPTPKVDDSAKKTKSPKTGDESRPVFYIVLTLASIGAVLIIFMARRNKKTEN